MKYIEKQLEDNRTGASVNYHEVTGLQVDYLNHATYITIASYVSKAKKEAGKELLSVNTFTIPSVPAWDQIPYEWALSELVKAQPEEYVPEDYEGYVNPYLFASGKVKE
ncbi:hypothetical protein L5B97_09810 [Avibacterium sp. 20-15]|uniref:hypothetical protein n=1 Tax=unclassified Avibacterium TaxID=2685287 RepID=UPI002026ED85|nr:MULTISPECIES: hypothetical protein [unclassified Avibacterium]MCW9731891.1 hypothetical protein [Avibacterium sp. 20-15]MCW9733750.1 hypothetical protein [Avibacterium sp. 20-15]URL03599.1 hypothetical protein L4F93_08500 [Avibacterium sp. 20-132]URL04081.1 hypothetical protein L4F93_11125 [Avibacterium sp. 20-132]